MFLHYYLYYFLKTDLFSNLDEINVVLRSDICELRLRLEILHTFLSKINLFSLFLFF